MPVMTNGEPGKSRSPEGGEVRPTGHLERVPGERYAAADSAPGGGRDAAGGAGRPIRAAYRRTSAAAGVAVAVAIGAAAALLVFLLGFLALTLGLLAVSGAAGWAIAAALRQYGGSEVGSANRRSLVAAAIALVAVAIGLGLLWAWALTEGGVLDPVAYLSERFGPLWVAILAIAPIFAALRAR
jgi:hypothetical protein